MAERPISVGELLRREGQQSETHDSQARRALGGVAVGAVLAFGAVVGGLMIHNAGATPSDLPVAGGGAAGGAGFNGSVPIASTGTIGSNTPKVQPAANTTTTANSPTNQRNSTTPSSVGNALGGGAARNNQVAQTTDPSYPSSSGTLPTSTGSTSTGSTSTGTSTSGSTSTPKGSTNPGTSSANPGTSSSTPTTGSNGGGLLGGLGSTLGSVTQPVFNWFGGN